MSSNELFARAAAPPRVFGMRERITGKPESASEAQKYADLEVFFGPRADTYVEIYDRVKEKKRALCWPAFFLSFVWFFYRKMYLQGAVWLVLPIVLVMIMGAGAGGTSMTIIYLLDGNREYVQYANSRLKNADRLGLTGDERVNYLRRAGGVSWAAGTLAGIIYAGMAVIAIAALLHHKA